MTRLSRTRTHLIGIDVGNRWIKAVQLGHAANGWQVHAAAMLPRTMPNEPLDESEAARLRATLRRQGFTGQTAVLAAPEPDICCDVLELPLRSSGAPLDQIAKMELARIQQRVPDSFEMAMWELPPPTRGEGSTHVMVAACAHSDGDALLDLFEDAGWHIKALDLTSCALARACASAISARDAMTAMIDLGATHTTFTLTHQSIVAYERRIPDFSIAAIRETIASHIGLDDEMIEHAITQIGLFRRQDDGVDPDAVQIRDIIVQHVDRLIEELRVSISYARHRYSDAPMSQLVLVGGGAAIPGLDEHIAENIEIDTRPLAPSDLVDIRSGVDRSNRSPALTAALGLALHGTGSST